MLLKVLPYMNILIFLLADDNEDDDYEEYGGGNHLLGFMFGNVDNSGDLDVDYLDEVIHLILFRFAAQRYWLCHKI